jgi:hypothetical protein
MHRVSAIVHCIAVIQYNHNRNRVSLDYLFQENKSYGTNCHLHSSSDVREVVSSTSSSSSPSKAVWSPTWPTSLRTAGYHESSVNCFSRHTMGQNKFPDSLPPVILHFDSDISDGIICNETSLIPRRCRQVPLLCLLIITYIGVGTIDLLDNFLKLLKAFSGSGKHGIAMTENERGQERKTNS